MQRQKLKFGPVYFFEQPEAEAVSVMINYRGTKLDQLDLLFKIFVYRFW